VGSTWRTDNPVNAGGLAAGFHRASCFLALFVPPLIAPLMIRFCRAVPRPAHRRRPPICPRGSATDALLGREHPVAHRRRAAASNFGHRVLGGWCKPRSTIGRVRWVRLPLAGFRSAAWLDRINRPPLPRHHHAVPACSCSAHGHRRPALGKHGGVNIVIATGDHQPARFLTNRRPAPRAPEVMCGAGPPGLRPRPRRLAAISESPGACLWHVFPQRGPAAR